MAIFWYYRPEQTESERIPKTEENEIFASRHRDVIPVECIDDRAYVLTLSEYCRYLPANCTHPLLLPTALSLPSTYVLLNCFALRVV